MNLKNFPLYRYINHLLIILLNIPLLLNKYSISKTNAITVLHFGSSCRRRLAQSLPKLNDTLLRNGLKEKEISKSGSTISKRVPFRCDEADLSKNLTEEEIINLTNSFGPTIREKDVYVTFYYYHHYLIKEYNNLVSKLWNLCEKLALKYKASEDDKVEYWLECKSDLSRQLLYMNHNSFIQFYSFIENGNIEKTINFKKFLFVYAISWNMKFCEWEHKWTNILTTKMKKHKPPKWYKRRKRMKLKWLI
ncbi:RAD protein [Plasmodium ovale]|uniref:RAD protein n=1 Tax=Plasmodium ovale TaxID=36330 RepID=A0A1C3KR97_PLAOA|nr:RAD protein [Plasmodium ovale]